MQSFLRAAKRVVTWPIEEIQYRALERREFRAAESRMSRARLVHQAPFRAENGPRRLCLFAHFDRDDRVDPHVLSLLNGVADCGAEIVFVSTCRTLPETDVASLRPLCARILLRDNIGLDFGSWKEGLRWIGSISDWDELILTNDSVYGPMTPLADVFQRMAEQRVDLWGITDSLHISHHLQSYFLVFRQAALQSEFFSEFWGDFRLFADKWCQIRNYEIGLSIRARRAGLKLGTLCDTRATGSSRLFAYPWRNRGSTWAKQSINPMHHCWRELLVDAATPYLKVQLLRDNPFSIPTVGEWKDVVTTLGQYDPSLIENHLSRVNRTMRIDAVVNNGGMVAAGSNDSVAATDDNQREFSVA